MSGGVDSSVAAHLLLQQGYRVEGLFMKNWEEDDGTEYCTAMQDLADAERVCEKLDIPLHTANFAAEYWDNVFEDFLIEYRAGRTPNPDVLCNREIKFKQFVDYAESLGADLIATGHYARSTGPASAYHLLKGVDDNKDQTYFLQAVPRAQLQKCLFPLGEWDKGDVRNIAEELGLHNHARRDSTGICFIGERRFADFLARYIEDNPGVMLDDSERQIGTHRGLHQYTIGQRQGLNIGGIRNRPEAPWYVLAKRKHDNTLIVTQNENLLNGSWLRADTVNWLQDVKLPLTCQAKIRYRQTDQACRVSLAADGQLLVRFDNPQRAIAPGQYVAFYQADEMLGGARIQHADQLNLNV
jgi:tRNA-specific 2-thiouridylase